MRQLQLFFSLMSISLLSVAQETSYTPDYLFPIEPGKQNYFAGSMGELRTTHFHGGLDIKTRGVEGLPIYAAEDGYIIRMRVSPFGYGRGLYMMHPNGQWTVYGHLQRFAPKLEEYIVKKQYEKESFEIDLENLPSNLFVIKKGDIIGYSGNSGSSAGPHLHFEIRDQEERPLNPVDFGFSEVMDNIPPTVRSVRLRPLEIYSRVEGEFAPILKSVSGKSGYYQASTFNALGKVGVEIDTYDRADGTYNKYGINKIQVFENDQLIYEHIINRIPFDKSANINTFTDYKAFLDTKRRYQRLYKFDSNHLPIYPDNSLTGFIEVNPNESKNIRIELWDSFDNHTVTKFTIKGHIPTPKFSKQFDSLSIEENIMKVAIPAEKGKSLQLHFPLWNQKIQPAYHKGNVNYYLWDLRDGLPFMCSIDSTQLDTHLEYQVPHHSSLKYYGKNVNIEFREHSLFDTLYLTIEEDQNLLKINDYYTPLHASALVHYEVNDSSLIDDKNFVFRIDQKGKKHFVGGRWNDNVISFRTSKLGKFTILPENTPPKIILLKKWKSNQLRFKIEDEDAGISSYKATLNGQFILLEYDAKKDYIQTRLLNDKQPLKGKFKMIITDRAGNTSVFEKTY
ncbi:M23 family metallopeptidase [Flammeovirga sp. EKP202]|uniref:M23 family metallopeptidase n=1 Tax=Flammeovirga sp. EKP202 TaxID=2770592 RepID=UPI00165F7295|nr:M23 family metallopeptidase [Flammeovirga sp. EKP202]MBD0400403.1 M23 family metallopeptidase [Flammeovirga sp. EKP202]